MTDRPAPPLRTWRPMALWTVGILLALGLVWFVGTVAVPAWQAHRVLAAYDAEMMTRNGLPLFFPLPVERLGGQVAAARKISVYLRLPDFLARHRRSAVACLSRCGPAGLGPILRMLRSPDDELRAQAFFGLFMLGMEIKPEEVREDMKGISFLSLIASGAYDRSSRVRGAVVYGLKTVDTGRAVAGQPLEPEISRALVALLADPEEEVRFKTADPVMGETAHCTNDPDVIAALERALADPSARVRRAAADALGYSGEAARTTIPALERLKDHPDVSVRTDAKRMLEAIRNEESGE